MNRLSSDEIALFARVVAKGSFAAAAIEGRQTASAVSKAVTRLETKLGVRLFERTTRRLSLTPEGETLLAHGETILAALEAAEADVVAGRGTPRGRLRVSVGSGLAKYRLAPALHRFVQRYPEVALEVLATDRRVDLLAEGIDVALRTGPLADSTLIARRLGVAGRMICASPSYIARRGAPRSPDDLAHHDCLVIAGAEALSEWPFRIGDRTRVVRVDGKVVSDSAEVLRDLAISGLGLVRLIDFLLEDAVADGRLVHVLPDVHMPETVPIWAVLPPGRQQLPRVRVFIDFLAEIIGAGRAPPGLDTA